MSDLITAFTSLFSFLFTQLTAAANFFVQSVIGQLILCVLLFALIVYLMIYIIGKIRG